MTLEISESMSRTFPTKQEIIECFKGVGQTELPTRDMIVRPKSTTQRKRKNPNRPRYIFANTKKKPSQSYLSNLNPRMERANKLWHSLWAHEKGELLKAVGVSNPENIIELVESVEVPDCVSNHFMLK